jgi:hypothetical protein
MAIAVGVLLVPNPSLRTANLFYNRKPKEEEQSGEKKIDWSLLVYFAWGSLASFTISHSVPTSKAPPVVTTGYQQPLLSKQLDPQASTSPKSARREVGTETSARPGLSSLRSIGSDQGIDPPFAYRDRTPQKQPRLAGKIAIHPNKTKPRNNQCQTNFKPISKNPTS